ncbi:hypothetical protein BON22_3494 [Cyberlindnera fabianii]|uniref:F-box domain-containing protein n=2 Tax=Cyberlindnera fabianii TaxID=36022 RepID=A0A1V2L6X5_CYBFA|nr:hypothetical protein BON22_3494 [Cyberlindnera fabianii]
MSESWDNLPNEMVVEILRCLDVETINTLHLIPEIRQRIEVFVCLFTDSLTGPRHKNFTNVFKFTPDPGSGYDDDDGESNDDSEQEEDEQEEEEHEHEQEEEDDDDPEFVPIAGEDDVQIIEAGGSDDEVGDIYVDDYYGEDEDYVMGDDYDSEEDTAFSYHVRARKPSQSTDEPETRHLKYLVVCLELSVDSLGWSGPTRCGRSVKAITTARDSHLTVDWENVGYVPTSQMWPYLGPRVCSLELPELQKLQVFENFGLPIDMLRLPDVDMLLFRDLKKDPIRHKSGIIHAPIWDHAILSNVQKPVRASIISHLPEDVILEVVRCPEFQITELENANGVEAIVTMTGELKLKDPISLRLTGLHLMFTATREIPTHSFICNLDLPLCTKIHLEVQTKNFELTDINAPHLLSLKLITYMSAQSTQLKVSPLTLKNLSFPVLEDLELGGEISEESSDDVQALFASVDQLKLLDSYRSSFLKFKSHSGVLKPVESTRRMMDSDWIEHHEEMVKRLGLQDCFEPLANKLGEL